MRSRRNFECQGETLWRALSTGGHRDHRCVATPCTHAALPASVPLFNSPPLICNDACIGTLADCCSLSTLSGFGIAKSFESEYDLDLQPGVLLSLQMVL